MKDENKHGGMGADLGALLNQKDQQEVEDLKSENKLNVELLVSIIENQKDPRISFWGPKLKVALWYLKKTEPDFSVSKEVSAVIEEHIKANYPELWDKIDELNKSVVKL